MNVLSKDNLKARLSTSKWYLRTTYQLGFSPLVISAGMPRSGSTLLFNILRQILAIKYDKSVSSGWTDSINKLPKRNVYLIKTHHLGRYYRIRANSSFYTFRDIRTAAISGMRKFGGEPCLEDFREMVGQYKIAKECCDLIIKYEDLLANPSRIIDQISRVLDISVVTKDIIDKSFFLKPPLDFNPANGYSNETLLHTNHFTGTNDDEWRTLLSEELKDSVASEFAWWLNECGYPVT